MNANTSPEGLEKNTKSGSIKGYIFMLKMKNKFNQLAKFNFIPFGVIFPYIKFFIRIHFCLAKQKEPLQHLWHEESSRRCAVAQITANNWMQLLHSNTKQWHLERDKPRLTEPAAKTVISVIHMSTKNPNRTNQNQTQTKQTNKQAYSHLEVVTKQ